MLFRSFNQQASQIVTSEVPTNGLLAIQKFFRISQLDPKNTEAQKLELRQIEQTTTKHYNRSKTYEQSVESNFLEFIQSTAPDSDPSVRLGIISQRLKKHPVRPVLTSHPTRVISNSAVFKLHEIVTAALELDKLTPESQVAKHKRRELTQLCNSLIKGPFLQGQKLTPCQEAEYGHFIYVKMIESFPVIKDLLVGLLQRELGLPREIIENSITPSLIESYMNLRSWIKGDADGNSNTTAQSMSQTVPTHQSGMLQVYIAKTQEIKKLLNLLNVYGSAQNYSIKEELISTATSNINYYKRCVRSVKGKIWFEKEGSNDAVLTSVAKLVAIRDSVFANFGNTPLTIDINAKINSLIDIIELCGFTGGMQEYVRQTTELNIRVFDNLFTIVLEQVLEDKQEREARKASLEAGVEESESEDEEQDRQDDEKLLDIIAHDSSRLYSDLNEGEKIVFQEVVSKNPRYFLMLHEKRDRFSEETQQEFQRLSFIINNKGLFPFYICSNTETKNNFNEVSVLMRFAQFLIDGNLHIGEMNKYVVNMMFLVESPSDMKKLEKILDDIFRDRHLRARIAQSGFMSCVLGPSDLGKEGGVATHITLYQGRLLAQEKLAYYKTIYPELRDVEFLFLNGYGSDYKRRIRRAGKQSHSTFQGVSAYLELGAPWAFADYMSANAGRKPQSELLVEQIQKLREYKPHLYALLKRLEEPAVSDFERFIKQPVVKQFLENRASLEAEGELNKSSRAASKAKAKKDITKLRAIGVVNVYIYMLLNFDIFMGVRTWEGVGCNEDLHELYKSSGVIQDIVDKVLYSLAVSDIDRSWLAINNGIIPRAAEVESLHASYLLKNPKDRTMQELLAFIEISARSVLQQMMQFAAPERQFDIREYFANSTTQSKSLQTQTVELMELFGDDMLEVVKETRLLQVDSRELGELIDRYTVNNTQEDLEAVVRCLRGTESLFWGPDAIANRKTIAVGEEENAAEKTFNSTRPC